VALKSGSARPLVGQGAHSAEAPGSVPRIGYVIEEFTIMFLVPIAPQSRGLWRSFDRLFDDSLDRLFAPVAAPKAAWRSPALDVAESDQAYTVTLDLPGVAKDHVKVSVEGRHVTIEARASTNDECKDGDRIVYRERAVSSFARTFVLPAEVDQDRSSAKLDNGVLKLELAKRQPVDARRIAVN
jgi:HSP20 family protein